MDFLGKKIGGLRKSASGTGILTYKPKQAREVYYMYKDEFGFVPKKANHLMQFAKQKDYILKFKKAEELLNDPPKPPKQKLEFGGYEWSDSDDDESTTDDNKSNNSSDDEYNDNNNLTVNGISNTRSNGKRGGSVFEHNNSSSINNHKSNKLNISDFDKLKRTQLIQIGDIPIDQSRMSKYVLPTSRTEESRQKSLIMDEIVDNSFHDESGYSITPLTNNIIINFHLDIPTKQWSKVSSKVFFKGIFLIYANMRI